MVTITDDLHVNECLGSEKVQKGKSFDREANSRKNKTLTHRTKEHMGGLKTGPLNSTLFQASMSALASLAQG